MSYIPKVRTGGVEPPQHEATGLQPAELAVAQRPQRQRGDRPGSNRRRRGSQPRMLPTTPRPPRSGTRPNGDDRTRTGGLSPDKRALCSSELHPRESRGWDSNPRSRAHEAREDSLSSTAQVWLAGVEPAISGARSRWGVQLPYSQMNDRSAPPAGLEPAASGLRARRHRRFDHGGIPLRRQDSNLPLAINSRASCRLDHAGTKKRRQQDSNLRTARTVYAVAKRCLSNSAMPPRSGRRGSRTPKARRPTRFRDGIPHRWQSFPEWPRQASNLQPSA